MSSRTTGSLLTRHLGHLWAIVSPAANEILVMSGAGMSVEGPSVLLGLLHTPLLMLKPPAKSGSVVRIRPFVKEEMKRGSPLEWSVLEWPSWAICLWGEWHEHTPCEKASLKMLWITSPLLARGSSPSFWCSDLLLLGEEPTYTFFLF